MIERKREKESPLGFLRRLGRTLATQDGMDSKRGPIHATAYPVYMVRERVRIYGIDPQHTDPDGYEVDEETEDRVPYIERWQFVQGAVSLTRSGICQYIKANQHNLNEPSIYVGSMSRCSEMKQLTEALTALSEDNKVWANVAGVVVLVISLVAGLKFGRLVVELLKEYDL